MDKIYTVGSYSFSNVALPKDCTVCGNAEWGDVIVNGLCYGCARKLLKRVLEAHKHYDGRTAKGYWGRVKNLELDRALDVIHSVMEGETNGNIT